ncbi:hypothetical protein BCR44DRAFT_1498697 [Catenaria anguillulae PL171]|uniref:REJ domain-containing protein n=1 Tax=Catenaria anguillulae PL171 TaxID=765915 RepID=A0A1Y2HPJ1_9FUNG|nr:hypothetical protein BCR44DRAFT_1498697 [Catenaria anguillulae PL171]
MKLSSKFGHSDNLFRLVLGVVLLVNLAATSTFVNAQGSDNSGGGSDPAPPPAPPAPSSTTSTLSTSRSSSSTTSSTTSRSTTLSTTTSRTTTSSSSSTTSARTSTSSSTTPQPSVILTNAGAQPTAGTAADQPAVTTAIVIEPNGQMQAFGVAVAVAGMQLV